MAISRRKHHPKQRLIVYAFITKDREGLLNIDMRNREDITPFIVTMLWKT
jgi:hypothetical protein